MTTKNCVNCKHSRVSMDAREFYCANPDISYTGYPVTTAIARATECGKIALFYEEKETHVWDVRAAI